MRKTEEREINRITQIIANEAAALADGAQVGGSSPNLFPIPTPVLTQSKTLLFNGDYSHSVCTWNDPAPPVGDRNEEASFWFSNTTPVLGQVLSTATS